MKRLHGLMLALLGAGALGSACLVLGAAPALACGGFFRGRAAQERMPSLAYEQTLIVFDADAGRQEFVREVVFRNSKEPFGFVVPTPARPSVRAIKKSPFPNLQRSYPFGDSPEHVPARSRGGGGGARSPRPVEVLEERQVGSFRSFVLAATDGAALANWLAENGFVSTPSTEAWLAHYVRLKFFYVAMRYEPQSGAGGNTTAETVGISFDSPLPYYPYLEPAAEAGQASADARMLEVWLVSTRRYAPVALYEHGQRAAWVQPMQTGRSYPTPADMHPDLLRALGESGAALPKASELVVQRFADQKQSRAGFGDVVFVPVGEPALSDAQRARLVRLAGLLDPALIGEP